MNNKQYLTRMGVYKNLDKAIEKYCFAKTIKHDNISQNYHTDQISDYEIKLRFLK